MINKVKIVTVLGARPQFIKACSVSREILKKAKSGFDIEEVIIHTGQHYDSNMSENLYAQGFSNIVKKTNDPINGIWLGQKPQFQYNDILGN